VCKRFTEYNCSLKNCFTKFGGPLKSAALCGRIASIAQRTAKLIVRIRSTVVQRQVLSEPLCTHLCCRTETKTEIRRSGGYIVLSIGLPVKFLPQLQSPGGATIGGLSAAPASVSQCSPCAWPRDAIAGAQLVLASAHWPMGDTLHY
jgi:hypothetical protein